MRKLVAKINCPECARALVIDTNEKAIVHDHYHSNSHAPSSLSLIRLKNRAGLIFPSASVVKVIFVSERAFKVAACKTKSKQKAVSSNKNLKAIIVHLINQELTRENLFSELNEHEALTEDMHSSQLVKKIIEKYTTIRLLTCGKEYTRNILHKDKIGVRQQSTKLVLFKGI